MKRTTTLIILGIILMGFIMMQSCQKEDDLVLNVPINFSSIAPSETLGRPNNYLGCIEINSRNTDISVWDHGTVDGDIISLKANGNTILSNFELDGPSNKKRISHNFDYNGYNYLVLYAHNEGSVSPNTASIAINGQEFILESNLSSNGYVDIVVTGYGASCSGGGGSGGGGNGGGSGGSGGGSSSTGDVTFWTESDLGCGDINVTISGYRTKTISS